METHLQSSQASGGGDGYLRLSPIGFDLREIEVRGSDRVSVSEQSQGSEVTEGALHFSSSKANIHF